MNFRTKLTMITSGSLASGVAAYLLTTTSSGADPATAHAAGLASALVTALLLTVALWRA